jgi:hypothetical protein
MALLSGVAIPAVTAACSTPGEVVDTAQVEIENALKGLNVYERGNLPEPEPVTISGYFDITERGAYRYITNEDRAGRERSEVVAPGDSIKFMFDGRIFGRGSFDGLQIFYTNIEATRRLFAGNNPQFDTSLWPVAPLRIRVGDDPKILKSLQEALIDCRAGDGEPGNDDEPGGIASDRVRVYLTPNIAFGDRAVYSVPANSTIVFEVTDIEIIR